MRKKSILLSIKPEWVQKILDGEKTIEIRKKFPKDFVGWVYIYCTKGKPYLIPKSKRDQAFWEEREIDIGAALNGKVVCRFWCDNVETIEYCGMCYMVGDIANTNQVANKSCLDFADMKRYLGNKNGYAIHISDLEIFDSCWLVTYFRKWGYEDERLKYVASGKPYKSLWDWLREWSVKPPQNYCYVEPNRIDYDNKTRRIS